MLHPTPLQHYLTFELDLLRLLQFLSDSKTLFWGTNIIFAEGMYYVYSILQNTYTKEI